MLHNNTSADIVQTVRYRITKHKSEKKKLINPFAKTCIKISQSPYVIPDSPISPMPETKGKIRLALMSFPDFDGYTANDIDIAPRYLNHLKITPIRKGSHRCLVYGERKRSRSLSASYKRALTFVLREYDADIICVNELGLPADDRGPVPMAIGAVNDLAQTSPGRLIIAGTCHNIQTMCNTAFVFYPECPECGDFYHKQVSAIEEEEYIIVPPPRQPLSIKAFGLNIIIVICIDILDYSTIASIVQRRTAVDLMLVPAHTESLKSMKHVAKTTSQAMAGIVAICNYNAEDELHSLMYEFGKPKRPIGTYAIPNMDGWVTIHDINLSKFKDEKRSQVDRPPDQMDWLFNPDPILKLQNRENTT